MIRPEDRVQRDLPGKFPVLSPITDQAEFKFFSTLYFERFKRGSDGTR
jgi:hypothetical protein